MDHEQQKATTNGPITLARRVLNSLLFIGDQDAWEIPVIDGDASMWSTKSCIAISCQPDSEGPTTITVGRMQDVASPDGPLFDGHVETPNGKIGLFGVPGDRLLEMNVPTTRTHIRIWTDGWRDTETVVIGFE